MKYSIIKAIAVCVIISFYVSNTLSAQEDTDFDLPDISIFDDVPADASQQTQTAPAQSVTPQVQEQSIPVQPIAPQVQEQIIPAQPISEPIPQQIVPEVQSTSNENQEILPPVETMLEEPVIEQVEAAPVPVQQVQQPVSQPVVSQTPYSYPSVQKQPWISTGWGIGVGGGPNLFYGDLGIAKTLPSDYANELNFAGTVLLQKQLVKYVDMRGQLLYGTLSGYKAFDEMGSSIDLRFDATVVEYNMNFKINVTNAILGKVAPVSLYTYVGMGFSSFRTYSTNTIFNNVVSYYGHDGTTKYKPTIETMVPVGLGLEFKLSDNLFVNTDVSLRVVNTDKLDAHIGVTNQFLQDMYSFSSIGITYTFGKKQTYVPPVEEPAIIPVVEKDSGADDAQIDSVAVVDSALVNSDIADSDNASGSQSKPSGDVTKSAFADTDVFKAQDSVVYANPTAPQPAPVVAKPKEEVVRVTNIGESNTSQQVVQGLVYRVQILAVQNQQNAKLQEFKKQYGISEQVFEEKIDTWYKFTVGNYNTLQEASNYRLILVNKGIQGAFVVTYYNGKRISLQEARELQAK